jgi:hydrogenase maturation protein HypF
MARNLESLKRIVLLSKVERDLILSWRRPIVLLRKRKDLNGHSVSSESLDLISPGLDTVGVMLPYAPVHHLLFKYTKEPALVMTSANPSGVPMFVTRGKITSNLRGIVDYALVHNRRIHQRADDSVIKPIDDLQHVFIRRARGYVPEPLLFEGPWKSKRILAVGPEEKATAAIHRSNRIYLSQHIGDTDSVESLDFLTDAIEHFFHLLDIKDLHAVAHDLHPEFHSTELAKKYASEYDVPAFPVQHHHAHLAAIMVDRNLPFDTSIVCITADGYGYGRDSTAWGGEVLFGNLLDYSRQGGLKAHDLPGGDLSARYAARSAIGILQDYLSPDDFLRQVSDMRLGPETVATESSLALVANALGRKVGTVTSSSAGRFLDAASAILGVCSENGYDGECPMKLEAIARETDLSIKPQYVSSEYGQVLDTANSLVQLIELKEKGHHRADLAYAIQSHLGQALAEIAVDVAENNEVRDIGFSGGVALNRIVTRAIMKYVKSRECNPVIHHFVPPGDGGVSVGQVASAAARLEWEI